MGIINRKQVLITFRQVTKYKYRCKSRDDSKYSICSWRLYKIEKNNNNTWNLKILKRQESNIHSVVKSQTLKMSIYSIEYDIPFYSISPI